MERSVAKDTPLAEITLRRYEKPDNLKGRALVKKLCLSFGLLQVGDSRDVVVDVLYVLLNEKGNELSSEEVQKKVIQFRKAEKLVLKGIAPSNVRRQLKRLRDLYLVEKVINNYRITENTKLSEVFNDKIEKYLLTSVVTRVKEYVRKIDEEFLE